MADWLDDSFGRHIYGVRFHGEEKIYPSAQCSEISPDEMLEEIERLRLAMRDAARYLDALEANMLQNGDDMLLDECDPPSLVADRLRAALAGKKTDGSV